MVVKGGWGPRQRRSEGERKKEEIEGERVEELKDEDRGGEMEREGDGRIKRERKERGWRARVRDGGADERKERRRGVETVALTNIAVLLQKPGILARPFCISFQRGVKELFFLPIEVFPKCHPQVM